MILPFVCLFVRSLDQSVFLNLNQEDLTETEDGPVAGEANLHRLSTIINQGHPATISARIRHEGEHPTTELGAVRMSALANNSWTS